MDDYEQAFNRVIFGLTKAPTSVTVPEVPLNGAKITGKKPERLHLSKLLYRKQLMKKPLNLGEKLI